MLQEPRDIIMIAVGMGEQPEGKVALAGLGSLSPMHGMDSYRVAFWIPLPPHKLPKFAEFKRDVTRASIVPDVLPNELQAIRDGVIEEVVLEWSCEKAAPQDWRIKAMKAAWGNLARDRNGGVMPRPASAPLLRSQQIEARDFENRRGAVGA